MRDGRIPVEVLAGPLVCADSEHLDPPYQALLVQGVDRRLPAPARGTHGRQYLKTTRTAANTV